MATNFSTEFPIDASRTVQDVLLLACEWVNKSPHSRIQVPPSEVGLLVPDSVSSFSGQSAEASIALSNGAGFEIGGLRYLHSEDGLEWNTSIVSRKTQDQHLLSIKVSCEALNTAIRLPPPRKPYFIRLALDRLGGGMDGQVPVTDMPFRLSTGEAEVAAALMLGVAKNTLPIVYVSTIFDDSHLIEPEKLAQMVSGMAHVVVEPNRSFSYALKKLTRSRNVYGGTIGVYWPESDARKSYFLDAPDSDARGVAIEIAKDIRSALGNRRLRSACTWEHLRETISRQRYELLKAQGSADINAYIEIFDTERLASEARIREADLEMGRLQAEVNRLSAAATHSEGLLDNENGQDWYPNEIRDVVVDALRHALQNTDPASRRHEILADLVNRNPHSGSQDKMHESIRRALWTYREMDAPTRSALLKIGFEIRDDGKHYKLLFQGDTKYPITISKTSSAMHAGRNMVSTINRLLF